MLKSLAIVLGLAALGPAPKPGVERWPIKTSWTAPQSVQHMTWDELAYLPAPRGVKKDDARYQRKLIPGSSSPHEGQLVQIEGYLRLAAADGDGDFHLQITKTPEEADCIIVEIPSASFVGTGLQDLQADVDIARRQVRGYLKGRIPSSSGSVLAPPPYVSVAGQLFFDDAHVGTAPRGKHGMKATSLWEIHPVSSISTASVPQPRAAPPARAASLP